MIWVKKDIWNDMGVDQEDVTCTIQLQNSNACGDQKQEFSY